VPSVTETLLAWSVTPVAVTRFCEAPGVATIGGTKNPDVHAIAALTPDLVVVDKEENRAEDADALERLGVALFVTHVRSVGDVVPTLDALADAVGVPRRNTNAGPVREPAPTGPKVTGPKVWVPIWRRPWMSINSDTYGASLLAAAGLRNVFDDASVAYPTMSLDEVVTRQPDFVLAPSGRLRRRTGPLLVGGAHTGRLSPSRGLGRCSSGGATPDL
jgi:ABC-type Fe3+-hydroxamate transport system substrate-binding protein